MEAVELAYPFSGGHWGGFQFLALMNKVPMNVFVQVFLGTCVFISLR